MDVKEFLGLCPACGQPIEPETTGPAIPIPWQEKAPKISPKRMRQIVERIDAATKAEDCMAMGAVFSEYGHADQRLQILSNLRSWERTSVRKLIDQYDAAKKIPSGEHLEPWSMELLMKAKDSDALQASWTLVQDAYAEQDAQIPLPVEAQYNDMRDALGPTGQLV